MVDEDGNQARMASSDEEVISQVADGRLDALRTLSDRFGGVIVAVATRILGNRADAEEVAADVIWQIWREGTNFDRRSSSVKAYLVASARSHAFDRLRARRSRRPPPAEAIEPAPEPASDRLASEATSKPGRVASSALDEEERRLLALAYYSELSPVEIGERVGIPPACVKLRIRAAMIKLRSSLKDARS